MHAASTLARTIVLLALVAIFWLSPTARSAAVAQQIFFAPVDNLDEPGRFHTSPDYPHLFDTPARWPNGLARLTGFQFTNYYIQHAPDAVLRAQLAFLKTRGIGVAVAVSAVLSRNGCGAGIEGTLFNVGENQASARRIQQLGGELAYLVADEPYTFGHATRPGATCKYPIDQVVSDFKDQVDRVRAVFPQVKVIDNEASSRLIAINDATLWIEGLNAALGRAAGS